MKLSRRDFLKASVLGGSLYIAGSVTNVAGNVAFAQTTEWLPGPLPMIEVGGLIRPPGALPEDRFKAKCIGCNVCVNVCHVMKYDAISLLGLNLPLPPFTRESWTTFFNSGTPHVKAMRDFPCGLCMECPGHCPTGALQKVEKENVKMGMALIDFALCFGWNGDICLSCSKACPMGGKIFDFYNGEWGNQPYINEKCVGCGLCVKYCQLGGSAIKVITREQYKKVKPAYTDDFKKLLSMQTEERYNIVYGQNIPNIMSRGRIIEREYR